MTLGEASVALTALASGHARPPGEVRLRLGDAIAEIVIDNPAARGALTVAMMGELARAVEALTRWEGAAVILRSSTPGVFCAGAHLGEVRTSLGGSAEGRVMAEAMGVVLDALLSLSAVSVAVIDGPAIGGGAELATATDHRVIGRGGYVEFRQAALGVGAGWGGVRRLVVHVAPSTALRWVTTAARIDADAAARDGLALACGPDPLALADEVLAPVLALPAAGVRAVKRQLAAARALSADRTEDVEAFVAAWGGPAHRAALTR